MEGDYKNLNYNLSNFEYNKGKIMIKQGLSNLKSIIFIGIIINTLLWLVHFSKGIIIVDCFLVAFLFMKGNSEIEEKLFTFDVLLFLSMFIVSSVTALLVKGGCLIFENSTICMPNEMRLTIFALYFGPFGIGFAIWAIIRLPKIIRSIIKKM